MGDVRRALEHPVLAAGTDADLAREHGCRPEDVRAIREEMRRDVDTHRVRLRARELAALIDWDGPLADLVEGALADAVARERRAQQALMRRTTITGPGHSVGRDQGQPGRPKRPGGTSDTSTREIGTRTRPRWRRPRGVAGAPGPRPRGMREG